MLYRLTIAAFVVMQAILLTSHTLAQSPPSLEIADFIPASVQYPKGPMVTVRNRQRVSSIEAWVLRHLDGAVIRRYVLPVADRWSQELEVTEPTNDRLLALVQGKNINVPFTFVLLNNEHVVELSRAFVVRVNSARGWDTGKKPESAGKLQMVAYMAGGELTHYDKNQLIVKTSADEPARTFAVDRDTTVVTAHPKWGAGSLKAGDHLNIVYTESEGKMVAQEVRVGAFVSEPPSLFSSLLSGTSGLPPSPMSDLHFLVGTVVRVDKRHDQTLIVEIKAPRGSSKQWLVTQATRVMVGIAEQSWPQDMARLILPGMLVAAGANELKESPIPAVRILLLQDRSSRH